MTAPDLPALSGAERLLLQRSGVGRAGVLAVRQVLAAREQAITHREQARADSAIEHVRRREEDSYDQGCMDGYDSGRAEGYKEGLDHGKDGWQSQIEFLTEQMHLSDGHVAPFRWCTVGACVYLREYEAGAMDRAQ